jgi:hypothetical protein
MKIQALAAVLALACGTAFAAQDTGSTAAEDATNRSQAATSSGQGSGVIDKTKNAVRRLGDKLGAATSRADRNKPQIAAKGDTRSMGAPSTDMQDGARQQRMDEAYANWKSKQK